MIVENGKYYIYRHVTLNNIVFYIGRGKKGKIDLMYNGYSRANSKNNRTSYWKRVSKKYEYIIEILIETDDFEFLCKKEKEFIKLYGRRKLKTGTLVNFGEGGEAAHNGVFHKKRTYMYDLEGNYIKSFNSIKNVANKFKVHSTTIIQCMKGKQIQTNGFQFRSVWTPKINKISYKIKINSKIIHINLSTNKETIFNSPKEASIKLGIKIKKIYNNLHGESKIVEKIHKFKHLDNE